MGDQEQKSATGTSFIVPTLLSVLALVGGWVWQQTYLNSLRPSAGMQPAGDIERGQNVEARMWQDPIAAVEQARLDAATQKDETVKSTRFEPLDSHAMKRSIQPLARSFEAKDGAQPGVRVLLAIIPGAAYAEEAEARLRLRQAVVSALSVAGYRAQDDERIGAWEAPWPRKIGPIDPQHPETPATLKYYQSQGQTSDVLFPFEWFVMRDNINPIHVAPRRVLVIWLPDSLFDEEPLGRLTQVVQEIRRWQKAGYPFDFAVLGPVGSAMLRSMLPWQRHVAPPSASPGQRPEGAPLCGVKMFSWSATAMDGLLIHGWESNENRAEIRQFLRETWGLDFINTISTDDELSAELIDELSLRGVDLTKEENHAVLLYEWDTFYGRTLPLSFAVEVRQRQDDSSIGTDAQRKRKAVEEVLTSRYYSGNVTGAVSNLQAFTYLRGIDGKLAKEPDKKDIPTGRGDATTSEQRKQDAAGMNRAEGQNQLDYIPRIAQELRRLDGELARGSMGKPGSIKAIGLMGSDFYDKLLILQALRPHFPNAIFFTTDMDARFLDPEFERWTRNLVVASSFGLNLAWHVRGNAPPFRGSYQTSLFYATLGALDVQGERLDRAPTAQRFAIGRLHAVNLSPKADPAAVQPSSERHASLARITLWILVAGIVAWLLVIFSPPLRSTFMWSERNYERQKAVLFTEDDILWSDRAIPAEPLPTGFGALPSQATPFTRASLALWLNGVFLTPLYPAQAVSESKLRHLTGRHPKLDWWLGLLPFALTKRYWEQVETTARLARWRLVLESRLGGGVGTCQERCRVLNAQLTGAYTGVGLAGVFAAVILCCVIGSHVDPRGEPFSLFEGVSAWPCEILRALALTLTGVFAGRARLEMRANEARISEHFGLRRVHRITFGRLWKQCWRVCRRERGWLLAIGLAPFSFLRETNERFPAIRWRELKRQVSAEWLWRGYRDRSRSLPRLIRSGKHLGLYAILCVLLVYLTDDWTFVPARGGLARGLDAMLLLLTIPTFLYLNILVADAVRLARTCILLLCNGPTEWPPLVPARGARTAAFPSAPYEQTPVEWRDILFIGQLTRKLAPLVYYPAIVLCILIVARTRYFDDWSWPPALVIIFAMNASWPILSAFLLQTAAKRARKDAVASLASKLACEQAKLAQWKMAGSAERVANLQDFIDRIEKTREGAFGSYLDNPALKALLVPFTGAGVMNLVNLLATN